MKLLRFGNPGEERPGILDAAGEIRDLSSLIPDIAGDVLTPAGLAELHGIEISTLPRVTGTPPGVGSGQKPVPVYLRSGQTMRLGIDGLGDQQQRVI